MDDDYATTYRTNGKHLDAVRQLRDFRATGAGAWRIIQEKDSLTGKEESLCGGTNFQKAIAARGGEIPSLFKHADHVGAITFIKRVWHIAWLAEKHRIKARSKEFPIRSVPAIAARELELDDNRAASETSGGEKHIVAIAFDGDSIGAWINGDKSPTETVLSDLHRDFSKALSSFALGKVREIVEGTQHDREQKN